MTYEWRAAFRYYAPLYYAIIHGMIYDILPPWAEITPSYYIISLVTYIDFHVGLRRRRTNFTVIRISAMRYVRLTV